MSFVSFLLSGGSPLAGSRQLVAVSVLADGNLLLSACLSCQRVSQNSRLKLFAFNCQPSRRKLPMQRLAPPSNEVTAQSTRQEMRWLVRARRGKPSPGEQSVQPLGPVSAPNDAKSTANSGATPPAGIGAKQHHIYYSGGNAQSTRQAMRWPVRSRRGKPSPGASASVWQQ